MLVILKILLLIIIIDHNDLLEELNVMKFFEYLYIFFSYTIIFLHDKFNYKYIKISVLN